MTATSTFLTRRTAITGGCGVCIATALAACSGDPAPANTPTVGSSADSPSVAGTPPAADSTSATDPSTSAERANESTSEAKSSSDEPSSAAATSGDKSSASGGTALAAVDDIPDGGCLVVSGVLLGRRGDKVVGHSSTCTHQGGLVAPDQAYPANAKCPLHGSVFNASTGAVITGPAVAPLPVVKLTVDGGKVFQA